MGLAMEVQTFQVTAPGSSFLNMLPLTGDTGVIRYTNKKVKLAAAWQRRQVIGTTRIISPLLHDNVRGIEFSAAIGLDEPMMGAPYQSLQSQDTLTVNGTGSAVAGDIEQSCLLLRYDDLPGIQGNFIDSQQLNRRFVNRFGVKVAMASALATGQYDGSVAINAAEDVFKANTEYAILGLSIQNPCTLIGIKSPDWGNLRVGMPGVPLQGFRTGSYFVDLSDRMGAACIPVFNSANKLTTLLDFAHDENLLAINCHVILAELRSGS